MGTKTPWVFFDHTGNLCGTLESKPDQGFGSSESLLCTRLNSPYPSSTVGAPRRDWPVVVGSDVRVMDLIHLSDFGFYRKVIGI